MEFLCSANIPLPGVASEKGEGSGLALQHIIGARSKG